MAKTPPTAGVAIVVGDVRVPTIRMKYDDKLVDMIALHKSGNRDCAPAWLLAALKLASKERPLLNRGRSKFLDAIKASLAAFYRKRMRSGVWKGANGRMIVPGTLLTIAVRGRDVQVDASRKTLLVCLGASDSQADQLALRVSY